jgi:Flp pilus assembly protein TadD
MKSKKKELHKPAAPARPTAPSRWPLWTALGAALIAVWWAYSPALTGGFLFDDTALAFLHPDMRDRFSILSAGVRPMTMFTYWLNVKTTGADNPTPFHVLSVLIHLATTGLVFLIARRLLDWAGTNGVRRDLLAGFAASIFLLHPVQTESVAYIAGRSEPVSVLFAYAAFAVFLYRRQTVVSWTTAAAVLFLFGLGVLSKENIVVVPAWLLLTDFWWNPGWSLKGIRANWRLYVPVVLGGIAGVAYLWRMIFHSTTAGFGMKDLPWYQYLFTQFRAVFVYLGLFVAPIGLNIDRDFPYSRTLTDHGSVIGLIVLIALIVAAWIYRRRFPLATYGFLTFLLLLAPTSSILPIKDPIAERRLYLPMIGLLLMAVDFLGRVKLRQTVLTTACVGIALIAAVATHARAEVWSDPVVLWEDTARKSPNKPRVLLQLGQSYYDEQQYMKAISAYERVAALGPPTYDTLINWGLAYDRLGQFDLAINQFRRAAEVDNTAHVWSQIGMVYAQKGQRADAFSALARAEQIDPKWAPTYNYRAKLHFQANELPDAIADYRKALELQPSLADAREELARAENMLHGRSGK